VDRKSSLDAGSVFETDEVEPRDVPCRRAADVFVGLGSLTSVRAVDAPAEQISYQAQWLRSDAAAVTALP